MTDPTLDPEEAERRLADVQDDIDAQRHELEELEGDDDEPKFSDPGVLGPVDDQIAPG